jgi:hypothetical protein
VLMTTHYRESNQHYDNLDKHADNMRMSDYVINFIARKLVYSVYEFYGIFIEKHLDLFGYWVARFFETF